MKSKVDLGKIWSDGCKYLKTFFPKPQSFWMMFKKTQILFEEISDGSDKDPSFSQRTHSKAGLRPIEVPKYLTHFGTLMQM